MSEDKLIGKKLAKPGTKKPTKALPGKLGEARRLAWIAVVGVAVIAAVVYFVNRQNLGRAPGPSSGGLMGSIGGPFTLVDHTGKTVSEQDFSGEFMLLTFGYTYCPDVCPTELSKMATALDLLGEAATQVTPVFISIDPARDTPQHLKEYVGFFHPRLRGLTGTPEQVAAAAKVFRVYFKKDKLDADADDYTMDHSALTYLVGPNGAFITQFRHSIDAKEMALRIIEVLL